MGDKVRSLLKLISAFSGKESLPERTEGEDAEYPAYLKENSPSEEELNHQREAARNTPVFTLFMNMEGSSVQMAEISIRSLLTQTHAAWELYLELPEKLRRSADRLQTDARVHLIEPSAEGEHPFTEALEHSEGEYLLLIDPGDTLPAEALYCFAESIRVHPDIRAFYADEDERDGEGNRAAPEFKPDFSRETLMSYPMVGRPFAVSRSLWEESGGLYGYSAAAEYDFHLRTCFAAERVVHISNPLYTRGTRKTPTQSADARESLKNVLKKEGQGGYAMSGMWKGSFRIRGALREKTIASLIIAGDTDFAKLRRLLESIEDCTTYDHYELIVLDRGTADAQLLKYYEALRKHGAARVIPYVGNACVSAMRNFAAETAKGDALVFLDPGVTVITPDWLESILETLFRPKVGAVSPKILTQDDHILSAGNVIGLCGWYASPYFLALDRCGNTRQDRFVNTLRRVSLLPAECLAVCTEDFFRLGKFDESFRQHGYEAEFCLRLQRKGLSCLYTPYAVLVQDTVTLPNEFSSEDQARLYDVLRSSLQRGDPYYSRNFDYASLIPKVAEIPCPPITLNPKAGS
ncbi:MAG: glycosyltransferase [Clostridia bacterium]|nr:glycosyltransferase [Clostridia bacterium]